MKKRRRIKVIITRRRTLRIQLPAVRVRCPVYKCEVETLTIAQAAEALEINSQMLNRLLAASQVHSLDAINKSSRVCQDSLFHQKDK